MKSNDLSKSIHPKNTTRNHLREDASSTTGSTGSRRSSIEKSSTKSSEGLNREDAQEASASKSHFPDFSVSGVMSAITPAVIKQRSQKSKDLKSVCKANLAFVRTLQSTGDFATAYDLLLQTARMTEQKEKNLFKKLLYLSASDSLINSSLLNGDLKSAEFLLEHFPPPITDATAVLLINTRNAALSVPYVQKIMRIGVSVKDGNLATFAALHKIIQMTVVDTVVQTGDVKYMCQFFNKDFVYESLVVRNLLELAKQLIQAESLHTSISRLEDLPIYET